jgi:GNAT superfamily N-acetyltransferase
MIRSHTEPSLRSKYTSIYEFYHNGNEEMKKYLISKIFGKESLNTRYHQFIETSNIFITYCVKYENNYVALLRMIRLNEIEYSKKLKNERLVNDLKQKGYQEIFYVYTLYVLPLYKRKGHGKHILSVLKNEKVPFVLCSSATAELSGVPDNVGSGYFYRKCGLEEYFPLSVQ